MESYVSPASAYRKKIEAEERAEESARLLESKDSAHLQKAAADETEFRILCAAIETDVEALRGMVKGEERTEKKRELLSRYLPAVDAYIDAGKSFQNPVLVQCMIWAVDCDDMPLFIRLSGLCFEQGQLMPANHKRTLYAFCADMVLEWAAKEVTFGRSPQPYFANYFATVLEWSIPDKLKAKYCKFEAELMAESDPVHALQIYDLALRFDPAIQIKTAYAKLKKENGKLEEKLKEEKS